MVFIWQDTQRLKGSCSWPPRPPRRPRRCRDSPGWRPCSAHRGCSARAALARSGRWSNSFLGRSEPRPIRIGCRKMMENFGVSHVLKSWNIAKKKDQTWGRYHEDMIFQQRVDELWSCKKAGIWLTPVSRWWWFFHIVDWFCLLIHMRSDTEFQQSASPRLQKREVVDKLGHPPCCWSTWSQRWKVRREPRQQRFQTTKEPPRNHQGTTKEPPRNHQGTTKEPPRNHQNISNHLLGLGTMNILASLWISSVGSRFISVNTPKMEPVQRLRLKLTCKDCFNGLIRSLYHVFAG